MRTHFLPLSRGCPQPLAPNRHFHFQSLHLLLPGESLPHSVALGLPVISLPSLALVCHLCFHSEGASEFPGPATAVQDSLPSFCGGQLIGSVHQPFAPWPNRYADSAGGFLAGHEKLACESDSPHVLTQLSHGEECALPSPMDSEGLCNGRSQQVAELPGGS